jgi:hypothetical protein
VRCCCEAEYGNGGGFDRALDRRIESMSSGIDRGITIVLVVLVFMKSVMLAVVTDLVVF